ncbi:MAG: OmpA family protein [Alphaproteobacteria bacterium]|nr:OmpA family protein [Alphaproteobacteria bacterium]
MAIRTVGVAIVLLALLIGAAFGIGVLDLEGVFGSFGDTQRTAQQSAGPDTRANPAGAKSTASKAIADNLSELAGPLDGGPGKGAAGKSERPTFDIARLSPHGVSVFAGRAKPFERVNVHVGDAVVGTASADGEGNWTLVTEEKIPDIAAELQLTTGGLAETDKVRELAQPGATAARDASTASAVPSSRNKSGGVRSAATPATAAEVNKQLFATLKGLVEDARAQSQGSASGELRSAAAGGNATGVGTATQIDNSGRPEKSVQNAPAARDLQRFAEVAPVDDRASVPDSASVSVGASASASAPPKASSRTIPIPVQFVYREAEFTEEGREAVELLLEYVKLSKFDRVTLSGHADERGSRELNIQLSRDRLNAVRDILMEGGFTGDVVLLPKGESEPFIGIDRSTLPREELYQLDRRVELRLEG